MNRNRVLVGALLCSVFLNLLIVGGIARRVLFSDGPPSFVRPLPPGVGWLARDLDESRRGELEPLLQSSEDEIRAARRLMFQSQREANRLMVADPLDEEALQAAFETLRESNLLYQQLSHEQTISVLGELTAEERQMAREFVQRRGPRDRGGRGPEGGGARFDGRPPGPPGNRGDRGDRDGREDRQPPPPAN